MFTSEVLLEIHRRTHCNFRAYLAHARTLDREALNREMPEFGGASVRLQLHHAINGERFWIGVLEGTLDVEEEPSLHTTIASLEGYRERAFAATEDYLTRASVDELNTPRPMTTDPGERHVLHPGHVVMRIITHTYHHQGQIATMFRVIGNPSPGFNYPIAT